MTTRVSIDTALIERAQAVSGAASPRAVVEQALLEFIAVREVEPISKLFGQLEWDGSHDDKRERSRA